MRGQRGIDGGRRAAVAVLVLVIGLLVGCGSSGSEAERFVPEGPVGPAGDAELIPSLLTVDELGIDLVEADGRREDPRRVPLCGRDDLPASWTAEATMQWLDPEPNAIGGVGESLLSFEPGGAEAWFATLLGCANLTSKDTLRYEELDGVGDQAIASVPAEYRQSVSVPSTTYVVRVGDRVVILAGAQEPDVLTTAVAKRAAAKAAVD